MPEFTIITKVRPERDGTKHGTSYVLPFRQRSALVAPFGHPRLPEADLLFEQAEGGPGAFVIDLHPVSIRPLERPMTLRVGGTSIIDESANQTGVVRGGRMLTVQPGQQVYLGAERAMLDVGYLLEVAPFDVPPEFVFDGPDMHQLQATFQPPCTLDKAAWGGPAAILAVAQNPLLTDSSYWRWAQCPWTANLRALAKNPALPRDLAQQLAYFRG